MSKRFYAGTRKGLFTFEKDGSKWVQTGWNFPGIQIPAILPDRRDGTLYAVVDHGHFGTKLHRSDDQGETWTELDPPAYPERPEDVPEVLDPFRQVPIPWSLEKVWALESAGPDKGGDLWCGTIPGGLFYSNDRGETWELNRSLWDRPERAKWAGGGYDFPGIHSICVDPRDSQRVVVAISCGGNWITKDGGENWTQGAEGMLYDFMPADQGGADPDGQDPHRMVQCQGQADHFWVQHHCGIFRSKTAADGWEEIKGVSPSAFGFAVAVHPTDSNTAWFAPALKDENRYPADGKFIVNRTRDGGETFEALSKGLPEPPAYDLIYRHALEVDDSGNELIMGSTTGGLWFSDDQGDSWDAISMNLPPVFCLRFS